VALWRLTRQLHHRAALLPCRSRRLPCCGRARHAARRRDDERRRPHARLAAGLSLLL